MKELGAQLLHRGLHALAVARVCLAEMREGSTDDVLPAHTCKAACDVVDETLLLVRRHHLVERARLDELVYGDLLDASGLTRLLNEIQPDEVYNLAA